MPARLSLMLSRDSSSKSGTCKEENTRGPVGVTLSLSRGKRCRRPPTTLGTLWRSLRNEHFGCPSILVALLQLRVEQHRPPRMWEPAKPNPWKSVCVLQSGWWRKRQPASPPARQPTYASRPRPRRKYPLSIQTIRSSASQPAQPRPRQASREIRYKIRILVG